MQSLRELGAAHAWTPEQLAGISQGIAKQKKIDEGIPIFGNGFAGNFVGGLGSSFLRAGSDLAEFVNAKGLSDTLEEGANYFEERLKPAMPAEFSWNYLTSPEGLARGSGNATGSLAAIALPVLAAEALPLGAAGAGVAGATRALSLAERGGKLLSRIPGISENVGTWATRGAMSAIPEAGMEAGSFEKNAVANGMSPSEAARKSWGVFGRNAGGLMLSNAFQAGLLPKLISGKGLGGRALAAGAELSTQALEEGYQQGFQNEMGGKPYTYNPPTTPPR